MLTSSPVVTVSKAILLQNRLVLHPLPREGPPGSSKWQDPPLSPGVLLSLCGVPRSGSMANPERYTNPGLQTKTEMQAGVETRHRWDGGIAWSKQRPVQRQVDQADWEVYTVDAAALHLHVKVYTLLKSSTPDLVYMPGSESGDSGAHPDAAVIWGSVFHDGKLLPSRQ